MDNQEAIKYLIQIKRWLWTHIESWESLEKLTAAIDMSIKALNGGN